MQESLVLPGASDRSNRYSSGEFYEFSGKISECFSRNLLIRDCGSVGEEEEKDENEFNEFSGKICEYFSRNVQIGDHGSVSEEEEKAENESEHDDDEEEEEEEFSFACTDISRSPISAEEAFQNGQIRPVLPKFDRSILFADGDGGDFDSNSRGASTSYLRPPLKKLFVIDPDAPSSSETEDPDEAPVGPYCEWTGKTAVETSPGTCRKSNSTGFSKLWRFRDLVRRSNSDGKDAFVFLSSPLKIEEKMKKVPKVKPSKTTPSAHEMHYVKNRARREEHKRRSYLPYRQGVVGVGFFTTVNGLSRNLHPF